MTDPRLGLARVLCPDCDAGFLIAVAELRDRQAASCPKCAGSIPVTALENGDPTLARVLHVLRERDRRRRS